jgi:transcription termination factor Rho
MAHTAKNRTTGSQDGQTDPMIQGILKVAKNGSATLLDPAQAWDQVYVPAKLVRTQGLVEGAIVSGPLQEGARGPQLARIESVCGLTPDKFRKRTPFRRLVAIDPEDRFALGDSGDPSMRIIDLVAPIGKGTRGLIVSPPKAGKTMLLEQIAHAIQTIMPETRIIILLIDERPEEVTLFRRGVPGAEVFASSADQPLREHIDLAELMLAHIRTELECGHDVVLLLDSLTRLTRAFNLRGTGRDRGRTLSGGLEAGAVEIPRRFFGMARNIEHGGSVTILATILVDTGSRLDQVIFEEFKGTGNSEIMLDRSLAEARIFPAINVTASGTRKEHLLYDQDEGQRVAWLRRKLASREPKEALELLLQLVDKYPTNQDLLQRIPLGSGQ